MVPLHPKPEGNQVPGRRSNDENFFTRDFFVDAEFFVQTVEKEGDPQLQFPKKTFRPATWCSRKFQLPA